MALALVASATVFIVLVLAVSVLLLIGWVLAAGDREGAMVEEDESPTLNTRNDWE